MRISSGEVPAHLEESSLREFRKTRRMLLQADNTVSKGEQTRQAIIERAAPLFNQRGYAGCSLADIMEATGLEKGGLYRHFSSKEELATEVFRYALRTAFAARGVLEETQGNPVEKLRLMVTRFVGAPSPIPGGCPLFNLAVDADDGNPCLRELAQAGLRR